MNRTDEISCSENLYYNEGEQRIDKGHFLVCYKGKVGISGVDLIYMQGV